MENSNTSYRSQHALKVAQNRVNQETATLIQLYYAGKSRNQELSKLNESLTELDDKNPDYREMIGDQREQNKMRGLIIPLVVTMGLDVIISIQPLSLLCAQWGPLSFLKFILLPGLLLAEIVICYSQALNQRSGEHNLFWMKTAQGAVIIFLLVLFTLALLFNIQSYNRDIDNLSFLSYISFYTVVQTGLLIFSIVLHLWVIHNAEKIAEAIAFFNYKKGRNKLSNIKESIEYANIKKFIPQFLNQVHNWIRSNELFKKEYRDIKIDFSITIPAELKEVINKILGIDYFPSSKNVA